MKKKYTLLLYLFVLLIAPSAFGQTLQVTPATTAPFTPVNLIDQVFLGDGVEVLNISYTGDPNAVGYFKLGTQDVGMYDGIIMTTGQASLAPTINNTSTGTGAANSGGSDPDLTTIAANNTFNAAIYTIDFIPSSDTLRFNYVFASEEYIDYVCSFNDVFGFFLSGPGITGPYTNMAQNIALVPGTTNTPVAVGTINNGVAVGNNNPCILTNTQYYVNNNWVSNPATSNHQLIYDGFTTVLTATAIVQPCSTYRIKLAIADALDQVFDSAVFLEANSFGTNGLRVFSQTPSLTNSIAEGCEPGIINFELDNPAETDYTLTYSVGGSAIMGVDYDSIPLNGFIPQGQSSYSLSLNALPDNITEGIDTIELYINVTPCEQDTFYIFIEDAIIQSPVVSDTVLCLGDTLANFLDGSINVPIPSGITFVNDTNKVVTDASPTSSYIDVSGVPMFNVQQGTIDSVCIDISHIWLGDLDVYLIAPDGQFMELTTDNGSSGANYTQTCFSPSATQPIAGLIANSAPFTGNYIPEGDWSDVFGSPVNGTWQLRVIDDTWGFDGTLNRWSISFAPPYNYSYSWEPADTNSLSCLDCPNPTVFPDTTTSFVISVLDSYGCITSDTATITVTDTLPAPTAICDSVTTNMITISWNAVDSATGYQVNVDGGGFNSVVDTFYTVTGLSPSQTVTFEVVAAGGYCPPNSVDTVQCTTLDCSLMATVTDTFHVSCNGYTDGSAIVAASNGFGNYYYSLNGNTAQTNDGTFSNLGAGNYQVIVSDDDGCADTVNFVITQPAGMNITMASTPVSCFGSNDGTATVTATGGTSPYIYNWSTTPPQLTPTATGLSGGWHYVTITDANSCAQVDSIQVIEPTPVTSTISMTMVSCSGGNDGTVTVVPTGGSPNYTYSWNTNPVQTTQTATMLPAGTYIVTITDANMCTAFDTIVVTEQPTIILSNTTTPVSCSGGSDGTATVTATGGTPNYSYAWNTTPIQISSTATGLTAGQHYVTVTDANGCFEVDTVTIGTSNPIIISITNTPAACIGINDGTATASATGGTAPYTYAWNTSPVQNNAMATGLAYGTHIVTVTDANGCFDTASVFINITTVLTSSTSAVDVTCYGGSDGSASISVTNGTLPFNYTWSAAGALNASTVNNLLAGTYYVTATDANGCFITDSVTVGQPAQVTTTTTSIAVSCNGGSDGSMAVAITGGSSPYTYAWSTSPQQFTSTVTNVAAGQYYVTVTDANNCSYLDSIIVTQPTALALSTGNTPVSCFGGNDGTAWITASGGTAPYSAVWSNAMAGDTISGLIAGSYSVTVTDANGCQIIGNVNVTEPAAPITINLVNTDVSCNGGFDGTATVTATGGTGAYSYLWSNNQNTATATNLVANSYNVTVTDANGCSVSGNITVAEPTAITLILDQTSASCHDGNDGMATVVASGGTPDSTGNYNYAWNTSPVQLSDTATSLVGGLTYVVVATDANGCSVNGSIAIANPDEITVATDVTNVTCFGDLNGEATVTPNGGTPSYTYQWDASANNQVGATATGLGVGTYTVTVTDANGCIALQNVSVIQPNEMFTTMNAFEVACKGDATGVAAVQVSGGTPSYTFEWDANANGQDSSIAFNLAAGTYYVSVADASGCILVDSVEVTEPALDLGADLNTSDVTCYDGYDGSVVINAIGGTPSYEFSFDNEDFSPSHIILGLQADNYNLYIRDSRGCTYQDSFTIVQPEEFSVDLGEDITIQLSEDTALVPIITNGVMPYTFAWTPIDSFISCNDCDSARVAGLQQPTRYFLTVTDATGCITMDDIMVFVDKPRIVYVASGFTPNGDNVNEWLFVQGDLNVVKVVSFQVFDRWGEKVFESRDHPLNDPSFGWDGTFKNQPVNNGVFGWSLEVEFIDGIRQVYKGNTTVIR